jgi:rhodanese-related sulfurtransferase
MNEITASELHARTKRILGAQCVDVRSASEYASGHLPGSVNIPMEQIEARLDDLSRDSPVVLICQSGKRARIVARLLESGRDDVMMLSGGTSAWIDAGFPLVVNTKTRWSLERQVRLAAGALILLGAVLATSVNPYWVYLSGFVGIGLTFAGLTDFCPMATLLGKMPWNAVGKGKSAAIKASCRS